MSTSEKDREAAHAVEAIVSVCYGGHEFNEKAMLAIAEAIATARAEGYRAGLGRAAQVADMYTGKPTVGAAIRALAGEDA